jgi:hypothetical protein
VIRRAIKRKGIKGKKFMTKAVREAVPIISNAIATRLRQLLG